MTTEIDAVVFDAYGTLFDVHSIAAMAEELFPGIGGPLTVLWREKQLEYSRVRALCGRYADFWTVTGDALEFSCERLGVGLDATQRKRLMQQYECLAAYPENLPALRALSRMRLPLAILSNGTVDMLSKAVAAAGMDDLFTYILSVDRVKTFKTAPEAYQLGPDELRCPPNQILFVSSNGWDVCGATWFGYTTFWLNRDRLPRERLGIEPSVEGRSMRDVVEYCETQRARNA